MAPPSEVVSDLKRQRAKVIEQCGPEVETRCRRCALFVWTGNGIGREDVARMCEFRGCPYRPHGN